jgi:hypothetical protein
MIGDARHPNATFSVAFFFRLVSLALTRDRIDALERAIRFSLISTADITKPTIPLFLIALPLLSMPSIM